MAANCLTAVSSMPEYTNKTYYYAQIVQDAGDERPRPTRFSGPEVLTVGARCVIPLKGFVQAPDQAGNPRAAEMADLNMVDFSHCRDDLRTGIVGSGEHQPGL